VFDFVQSDGAEEPRDVALQHNPEGPIMVNIEEFHQRGKEQYEAVIASAGTVTKGVQAIATAYADYSKKSFEESKTFVEKLAGVKSIEKAVEIQTEYAKTAYELFMAEMAKISELYKDLAKETYKPLASMVAKPPAPDN
jgi:hypothetical protein